MKVFDDLQRRGLVKQVTNVDKVRELLESESPITFYIGFDPTADSLHIGHLLQLITAKRIVDCGHDAIILIGGATARIGDPTGKIEMRKILSNREIESNSYAIAAQAKNIIKSAVIVSNINWFSGEKYLQFIQEVGPHFSVNNMLRADCFKSRMEHGLSFLEFNYMVMQAWDFRVLSLDAGCTLQIGGDDQWANILAGIDLIHKKDHREVFGLTIPLLINSDGTKMGKTERGSVWLDPKKTSPFEFFQFWRNISDDKVRECVNMFTTIEPETFDSQFDNINEAKKFLATTVTSLVHGWETAQQALAQAEALFEKKDISALETIPVANDISILDILIKCNFAKSRTDGRNLINNRGITINDEVLTDPTIIISKSKFGNDVVIKKGKKHFCRLLIEDICQDPNP